MPSYFAVPDDGQPHPGVIVFQEFFGVNREMRMRNFELRVYTLRNNAMLKFYTETIYPRHLNSFPLFGVEAHGFWTAKADVATRLFALVSYLDGDDPREVTQRYMQSREFADDVRGFDMADIVGVETTILIPLANSPLK